MDENTPKSDKFHSGFGFLRGEAIDAHLAGDGMRVLHLCTVALEHVRHPTAPGPKLDLAEIRWAVFLNLYWMFDDWLAYFLDKLFERVTTDELSSWDRKLIEFLATTLQIPLNLASIDDIKDPLPGWKRDPNRAKTLPL